MATLFYDHLIVIEEVTTVIGNDKKLLALVDQMLQHEILDAIFTYLPKKHHKEFLTMFHTSPNDKRLLEYLNSHSSVNMELAILDRANKTKRKILKEVKKHDRKA